jgi:ADP-heptose:LPS heptosyltransferase
MKTALVVRYGAFGDNLLITPVFKKLKELGYYVIVDTTERGREVFANNPNIDKITDRVTDSVPLKDIDKEWNRQKEEYKPDYYKNFSESLEVSIALHPRSPMYTYPKREREGRCNVNYYDHTEKWADLGPLYKRGELFFTDEEEAIARGYLRKSKFNLLWCLSGSGKNKAYPWSDYVIGEILKNHKNIHVITVGDLRCQLLESLNDKDITNLSGKIPIRVSMALTKFCDLVISPDTGILHAAGCFTVPKIGLLGHSTKENITKYFDNDHSIEAKCECAPCYRLIYDHNIQCPVDPVTHACWCMAKGIDPKDVYAKFQEVHDDWLMSNMYEGQKDVSGIKVGS